MNPGASKSRSAWQSLIGHEQNVSMLRQAVWRAFATFGQGLEGIAAGGDAASPADSQSPSAWIIRPAD
jgi:hypothetical protein